MIPHRVNLLSSPDFGFAASILSSCCQSEEETQAILGVLLSEDCHGVIAKGRNKSLGFALASHDLRAIAFPQSKSARKEVDVLDRIGAQEENVMVVQGLYVDPTHRRQGLGKELFLALSSRYPNSTWIALVNEEDHAAKAFFLACGFTDFGPLESAEAGANPSLFAKKYRPLGLCREAKW